VAAAALVPDAGCAVVRQPQTGEFLKKLHATDHDISTVNRPYNGIYYHETRA